MQSDADMHAEAKKWTRLEEDVSGPMRQEDATTCNAMDSPQHDCSASCYVVRGGDNSDHKPLLGSDVDLMMMMMMMMMMITLLPYTCT